MFAIFDLLPKKKLTLSGHDVF